MKNIETISTKKLTLTSIIATQHPVMLCWLLVSFVLICSMYIYTFFTL